jgi:MFS family permease
MIGFGIAWASMMGVPYIMVVSSIPKSRYGVYMGIVNMMIVVPMILQTLTFGYVYKNFLGDHPPYAICLQQLCYCLRYSNHAYKSDPYKEDVEEEGLKKKWQY